MRGILLINMGAPESECEVKYFLRSMFLDKHIIPAPYFIRNLLSLYIANTRYKKSWARYQQIGGTPLKRNTLELAYNLQNIIGDNFLVKVAYSYTEPLINNTISDFIRENINEIIAIPLYPQASITTTESVIFDIERCNKILKQVQNDEKQSRKLSGQNDIETKQNNNNKVSIKIIPEFYSNSLFVDYWSELITNHIKTNNLSNPLLLFSAHSIPLSFIKKGDTYQTAIEESAKLIANKVGLKYAHSYQSQLNEKTWLGPNTEKKLEDLKTKGQNEIVLIPISFVCENLETKYDLDTIIIPKFNSNNFSVSRVQIPAVNEKFTEMLISFIPKN